MAKSIGYKQGVKIVPDRETAFELTEQGMLEILAGAGTHHHLFNHSVYFFSDPMFIVRYNKETNEMRVYHREGNIAKFAQDWQISVIDADYALQTLKKEHAEIVGILARANGIPFRETVDIYKEARFDYRVATRIIELRKKNLPVEQKRYDEEQGNGAAEYCLRENWPKLHESMEPEDLEANVLKFTDLKNAFSEEELREPLALSIRPRP